MRGVAGARAMAARAIAARVVAKRAAAARARRRAASVAVDRLAGGPAAMAFQAAQGDGEGPHHGDGIVAQADAHLFGLLVQHGAAQAFHGGDMGGDGLRGEHGLGRFGGHEGQQGVMRGLPAGKSFFVGHGHVVDGGGTQGADQFLRERKGHGAVRAFDGGLEEGRGLRVGHGPWVRWVGRGQQDRRK